MIKYLARKFIGDYLNTDDPKVQSKYIALSGVVGLGLNIFLFISKLAVGLIANSIAIISDSFNNLSDSLTSVIAILGSIFSRQPADEEHPQGHGRFEYIASLFVSMVIMFVGFELLRSSVDKIRNPEQTDLNVYAVFVLVISILVKIYMYAYNNKMASDFDSGINKGVAQDSLNDVIATSGIFIAMIISYFTAWSLDGYAGVLISVLVMKTGFEFAKDTISVLVGEKPSQELIDEITEELVGNKYVRGYHDLVVHDYGRGKILATLHAEIPVDVSVVEIHNVIDDIERKVKKKTGVELVIHMDPSYNLYEQLDYEEKKMRTTVLDIMDINEDEGKIKTAADVIKKGGLVAMPTETVYGLAADGLNPDAVKRIFEAKNRPIDNPIILHVADIEGVYPLVKEVDEMSLMLMDKLWPGPLTLIMEKSDKVPDIISAGGNTVAIRMPDNEIARKLIKLSGTPLAAPSANLSGKPSPTNAIDVYVDMNGKVDVILDGGGSRIGIESTVLDMVESPPRILRPGYYTYDFLREFIPDIIKYSDEIVDEETPKSPGTKYRHYAPKAELIVYSADLGDTVGNIIEDIEKYREMGKKVGVMTFTEHMALYDADVILNVGSADNTEETARMLFSKLRDFDRMGVDIILAEGVKEKGLGYSIMNRLRKSADGKVVESE